MLLPANLNGDLRFTSEMDPDLSQQLIPGAIPYHAHFPKGNLVIQKITNGGYTLWHSHYRCTGPAIFHYQGKGPLLTLQLALKGAFTWKQVGEPFSLKAGQLNLFYYPAFKRHLHLAEAGDTQFLDIVLSLPYLKTFNGQYPVLDRLLEQMGQNKPCCLTRTPLAASKTTKKRIQNLLYCPFRACLRKMYYDAQVLEILIEVLDQATGHMHLGPAIKPGEMERIETIRQLLEAHPHERLTIAQLARKVHMNVFKLKQGFRLLTGTSIFDYHLQQRMEKARELLKQTDRTLDSIAEETGYEHLSSFIAAFKAIHGMTPAVYRKSKKE